MVSILSTVAMQILKFSQEDIDGIRKVLAAIVHLGNVDFTGPKDGHFSRVTNQKQVSGVREWVTKFNVYGSVCIRVRYVFILCTTKNIFQSDDFLI